MRLRLRGPEGTSTITLPDDAQVHDLITAIVSQTSIPSFDVKYGYPPQPLHLSESDPSLPLSQLGVKLNNEQLTVSAKDSPAPTRPSVPVDEASKRQEGKSKAGEPTYSFAGIGGESKKPAGPVSLKRKGMEGDVPEVALPDRGATLVLRVMPDDNSCLFRAFGTAVLPGDDLSMHELRSLVASTIQAKQDVYSKVVLEQEPDDYCRWIQTADAWGGAIELGILAEAFGVEVVCVDVQSLTPHTFPPPTPAQHRCILIYSGIHYDLVAQTPLPNASDPSSDQKIWDITDTSILSSAIDLCRLLQEKHYFTDTGGMGIRCNDCGTVVRGEKEAAAHAGKTGHWDMVEV
ncbi:OTU-like cysteine protease protein [Rutstroemia sp. NJR-2017a WRK4]|nr:OTU-like cysteine protease protein [Rutstroemia sp. NJR-2017a WRK4]